MNLKVYESSLLTVCSSIPTTFIKKKNVYPGDLGFDKQYF